jgi:hypothetical protein
MRDRQSHNNALVQLVADANLSMAEVHNTTVGTRDVLHLPTDATSQPTASYWITHATRMDDADVNMKGGGFG